MMMLRGVGGAITVERDESEPVISATERLLKAIVAANEIDGEL
jgi:chorismate mutase